MEEFRGFGRTEEVGLEQGVVRYREEGSGPVLVFVHGVLVNGALWRKVVPRLSKEFRCIVPDLPLGAHPEPMRGEADLSPRGVARLVADFLEALELRDVTLVGNDTGGAICQIVVAEHPGRIGRLVLTNCDAYGAFFPLPLSPFSLGPRLFGQTFVDGIAWVLRSRAAQRLLLRTVSKSRPDAATLDAYFRPLIRDPEVRRDLTEFLRNVSGRYTLEAARAFPGFRRPVLIVWGADDPFFSPRLALRLKRDFPDARLESVTGSRAFVPEDRPGALAGYITDFVGARTAAAR